jgi:hypothetical protein
MRAWIIVALLLLPAIARADDVRVGIYAPSAPFASTSARLDYATRLAQHMAGDGKGTGKVFARASDFAAAVKAGELDLAVVDATYLAATGASYAVLAVATHDGAESTAWQVVTRGGETTIAELKGKKLLVPSVGGHEAAFVYEAMLGGELPRGFFAKVDSAPDVVSALAALGLGRADAAIVPGGVDLPSGVVKVATLPDVPLPFLVELRPSGTPLKVRATTARQFSGGDVLAGFGGLSAAPIHDLAARFKHAERRGPFLVPNLRVGFDDLIAARKLAITRVPLESLLANPAPLPPPAR